jgi:hypothetical protein
MYVHWHMRTEQVVIELKEEEAERLVYVLALAPKAYMSEEEIWVRSHLQRNLEELDTSDHRPGI